MTDSGKSFNRGRITGNELSDASGKNPKRREEGEWSIKAWPQLDKKGKVG